MRWQRGARGLRQPRDERGAATVLVVAMVGVLLTVAVGVAGVGGLLHAHRRAQGAADLAALAAAQALLTGAPPCPRAAEVASANGATLRSCRTEGEEVVLEVEVGASPLLPVVAELRGRARAGPVRRSGRRRSVARCRAPPRPPPHGPGRAWR
ncbi:Rv3654c family TadE-like protein [Nocardioides campestrisoli]|uniref:Rv3654c family TadE-like protein n=1 Tax=Nocardioides campestrisoli TaxID=2736757 RepID=UPI0015E7A3E9